ncbi:hypothetical protein KCP70_17775 [Salmonella enterica subsp. enterica]|nr:hypothetical protein KCP70_17775 [Salmonella enterica subsp. enterica]
MGNRAKPALPPFTNSPIHTKEPFLYLNKICEKRIAHALVSERYCLSSTACSSAPEHGRHVSKVTDKSALPDAAIKAGCYRRKTDRCNFHWPNTGNIGLPTVIASVIVVKHFNPPHAIGQDR